jgi:RimJ/RimL family protein N-acetyltransferase
MWRNKIARQSLTDTIRMTKIIIGRSLDYFFETHSLGAITGDVAVANLAANFVLARMGFKPVEMVEEAYLGKIQSYNRYVFEHLDLVSNK